MASGVTVDDVCLNEFQTLKLKKTYKYIIFNLNKDNTKIIVEKTSTSQKYEDFITDLPEQECRWGVYDLEFEKDGAKRNKLTFFSWAPETAKVKQKMVFASSKEALRKALVGIALDIQATSSDETEYDSVKAKAAARIN